MENIHIAIEKMAAARARAVLAELNMAVKSDFEDIKQRMVREAYKQLATHRENPNGGESAPPTYRIRKKLSYFAIDIVREYRSDKRKVLLYRDHELNEADDDNTADSLIERHNVCSQNMDVLLDVRAAVAQLAGEKRKLAIALLTDSVNDLGWSSKKISKYKAQLKTFFQENGF